MGCEWERIWVHHAQGGAHMVDMVHKLGRMPHPRHPSCVDVGVVRQR